LEVPGRSVSLSALGLGRDPQSAARSVDPTRICELSALSMGNQMEIPPEALETVDSIMLSDLRKEELIDMLTSILGAQKARHHLLRRRESWIV
jgi:hypothetical protein